MEAARRLRPQPIAARSPSKSGFYREKRGRERVDRVKTECDSSGGIRASTALISLAERPVFSLHRREFFQTATG
jgi:hypothetical protein